MIALDSRLSAMLRGAIVLRWHQFAWMVSEWAWLFGLKPATGKWTERISFVYIYILVVGLMTPTVVQIIGNLYAAEARTAPGLQLIILRQTIPWIIAVLTVVLVALPWKAWLLRLTFGDITYLSPSPFDRRILTLWRYLEMAAFVPLFALPFIIIIAPMFGSVWFTDVVPAILRAAVAVGLWGTTALALAWHLSLQQYHRDPLTPGAELIARLSVLVAAIVVAVTRPDLLLWPGRLLVLLAMDQASWGWPLLIAFAFVGIIVVGRAAQHLSLTRASAASDVFARIQQLGLMILLNRQLLFSILSEARSRETRAVGTLPPAQGLAVILARAALHYRRNMGQALQLAIGGMALGLSLLIWRPINLTVLIFSALLLALVLPSWMAHLFRQDMSVPFVAQFMPQPLMQRLLVSSIVPAILVLMGMIPIMLTFGSAMPDWAWGIVPVVWVMSLLGHVDAVGRGAALGKNNVFGVLLSGIAILAVLWTATTSGLSGIFAFGPGVIAAAGVSFALLTFAEIRHNGFGIQSQTSD